MTYYGCGTLASFARAKACRIGQAGSLSRGGRARTPREAARPCCDRSRAGGGQTRPEISPLPFRRLGTFRHGQIRPARIDALLRRPKSFISRSERTSVRSRADPRSRMSGNSPALDGACSCFRIFPIAALQHVATSPVGKIKKSLRLLILSSLPPASSACVGQQDQFALVRLSHFAFPRRRTSFASDGATGQTFTDLAALIRAALATSLP
jgi:hypothetical protein